MIQQIIFLDQTINSSLAPFRNMLANQFFIVVSFSIFILTVLSMFVYFRKKNSLVLSQILLGVATVYVISEILKDIVLRSRPDASDLFSFPSRHAALAFFMVAIRPVNIRYRFALFAWALLISFSRIWLGLHWFSDVVAGAMVGLLTAYLFKQEFIENKIKKILKHIWR
jgi:undecaprenyl-diphosphatase